MGLRTGKISAKIIGIPPQDKSYLQLYSKTSVMSVPQQNIQVQIPASLPTVVTPNLLLRPLADSDAADLFAIRSRPEVAKTKYVSLTLSQWIYNLGLTV